MSSQQSVSAATGRASLGRLAHASMRAAVAILVLGGAAGKAAAESSGSAAAATARVRPEIYAPVMLQADVSSLTAQEREMLGLFIDAAKIMDGLFWQQAYGDRDTLLASLKDPAARQFAEFNYGPWDRLDEDRAVRARRRTETGRRPFLSRGHDEAGVRGSEARRQGRPVHAGRARRARRTQGRAVSRAVVP